MSNGTSSGAEPPVRPADLEQARLWLTGHGLTDVEPTPLLAARLAVRWRARAVAAVLPAVFILAAALAYVSDLPPGPAVDGFEAHQRWWLLALAAAVVGWVLAQSLMDRWVRRVDRRAGATLPRRATHPVRLGWRTVLGWPRAAFTLPTVVWVLPTVTVLATPLGWWNTAWLVFIVLGVITLMLITVRTARSGAAARYAASIR